eukprot:CAMPEP_0183337740 /NCGR_PEP_ID=MMETSP0164_2-20130417/5275_1 /TAXON_ID=221442 /ORGANISM="Coccolithus pelagicus ssp braarudi, Strain PLY182g" /LENGTH=271 /DNA_ID=CAMNT_0025507477 /DNA_START=105 /DNA_END=921 /DNA_ORIENTATION=-
MPLIPAVAGGKQPSIAALSHWSTAMAPSEGAMLGVADLQRENERLASRVQELELQLDRTEGLCETLDDISSDDGFWASLRSRAGWLLGLLLLQSGSSWVLAANEGLLVDHPAIIYFMTMLVGAGGNAGNQSAVRIIRGLATGEVNPDSAQSFVLLEVRMAVAIGLVLLSAGFLRVFLFHVELLDAIAISASLFVITASSVIVGAILPLVLNALRVDAAHAATTVQVIMDVSGVLLTCTICSIVFAAAGGEAASWLPGWAASLATPMGMVAS